MPLSRLFGTAGFRLALSYLAIFFISVLLLGAVVYVSVRHALLQELDERILEETGLLIQEFQSNGLDHLRSTIVKRSGAVTTFQYRLDDASGRYLSGSLPFVSDADIRNSSGWAEITARDTDSKDDQGAEVVRVLLTKLADGSRLLVGNDLDSIQGATRAVLVAFGWALAATLILGIGGGLLLSASFLRRIDAMTRTAQAIIGGDLRQRIPETAPNDDLGRLARIFNQMLDRIESLIEANKQVSNDIAHDLRSPLAKMLRGLENARRHARHSGDYEAAIDDAIGEIEGILTTFNALLRIGQIETKARRGGFKQVNLASIALDVAEAFQPAAVDEGKSLRSALSQALPMRGDKELLTQMVANLVDNAMRHTPAGTSIEIIGFRAKHSVGLIVADDGPGVPSDEKDRILERFYRADHARATPGSGLGLSLVAAVVDLHGGRVCVEDNKPGLKITIAFPASGNGQGA
ncbi:MAG: sensor histidine kinase [Hyphomicrobiales bacterium]